MNNIMKPVWNMKSATMATVAGVLMVPFAGVVAWNVLEPEFRGVTPLDGVVLEEKVRKSRRSRAQSRKFCCSGQRGKFTTGSTQRASQ